jgi:predicted AAA+ superfamily ATPase
VTGIRRSGKSFLLFELFREYLSRQGIANDHIIEVALDDRRNIELRDPDKMLQYIDSLMTDKEMYYILLDEVQMMDDFVGVLNSLLHVRNADVYVTGSNSRFLSKDVATEFRGRGDEIHLYPLSFAEYYSAIGGEKQARWKEYYTFGGLPQLLTLEGSKKKEDFLLSLQESVYIKDILERHRIKNKSEFEELLRVIASAIGSPCNPYKLSRTFKSVKGISIDNKTISNYLSYMEDAFFVEKAFRFDIKGKKYINTLSKYYFQDMGLRNALLGFRQLEENHIMENVIYNELRNRGFRVDVGMVAVRTTDTLNQTIRKQLEVDFVANRGNKRYYIQSAFAMPDEEKKNQEFAPLRNIDDSFKKIIIAKDDIMPYLNENGFMIMGLFDFLLDSNSLEENGYL